MKTVRYVDRVEVELKSCRDRHEDRGLAFREVRLEVRVGLVLGERQRLRLRHERAQCRAQWRRGEVRDREGLVADVVGREVLLVVDVQLVRPGEARHGVRHDVSTTCTMHNSKIELLEVERPAG